MPLPAVVHPVEQFLQGGWGTVAFPPELYQPTSHTVQFAPPRPGAQTCTVQLEASLLPVPGVVVPLLHGRQSGLGTKVLDGAEKKPCGQGEQSPPAPRPKPLVHREQFASAVAAGRAVVVPLGHRVQAGLGLGASGSPPALHAPRVQLMQRDPPVPGGHRGAW